MAKLSRVESLSLASIKSGETPSRFLVVEIKTCIEDRVVWQSFVALEDST